MTIILTHRASLVSPSETLERPIQSFHPSEQMAREWATRILVGRPLDAAVYIYEMKESEPWIVRMDGTSLLPSAATPGPRETA